MKIKTQLTLAALMAMGLFASGCSQQSADASVSPAQQTTQATSQQTTSQQTTSQQTTQQTSQQAAPVEEGDKVVVEEGSKTVVKEVVRTVVDCSKCGKRPGGRPAGGKWTHSHPAIPGCTNSITHSHPYTNRGHKHSYSCKKASGKVVKRPSRPAGKRPARPMGNKWLHTHPAIPGCTNSVTHAHPFTNRNHTHAYGCRGGVAKPKRPAGKRPQGQHRPPVVRPVPRPLPPVQPPVVVVPPVKAKGNYKGPIGYNPATLKMMSDYQKAQ
jgi:hypothetical protein